MEIRWRSGSGLGSIDPTAAHTELETLRAKHDGKLTAEDVVSVAKAKRNVLHPAFEWDDTVAAHEHRLHRARHMIGALMVVRDDLTTDRPQRTYQVVRDRDAGTKRIKNLYRSAEDVMKDPELRAEVLDRALKELIAVRNRFRDLQELAIVFRAIDEVIESYQA